MRDTEIKPDAVLYGTRRDWMDFVSGFEPESISVDNRVSLRLTMRSGTVYHGIGCIEDAAGRRFARLFTVGQFWDRKDARELYDYVEPLCQR